MIRYIRQFCAATALTMVAVGGANAETLRFAIGMPDNSPIVSGPKYFAENLSARTDGALDARLFTGSSLLNFSETFPGIRDGVADIGYVVASYHRAELKESNLIGDLGMTGTNIVAMAGAASEYCFIDEACRNEWITQGQVFLGFTSTAPYRLISTTPLATLDDVKGKRIRSFSAYGRWAEAMGAAQVNLPAGDIYEGFTQGTIDVNVHPYEALVTLSLKDVAKNVTDMQIGSLFINALFNTNLDAWRGWDEKTRVAVLDLALESIGRSVANTHADDLAYHEKGVAEIGVTVIAPDQALVDAKNAFVEKDLEEIARLNEQSFGVTDAQAKIERFNALVAKWEGLVAGIDPANADQVADLFRESAFGDLDKATYGM